MEQNKDILQLLDLTVQPGFCVQKQIITSVNQSARRLLLEPGMKLLPLLQTGAEDYLEFTQGCLYLQLRLQDRLWGASVVHLADSDVFLLDAQPEASQLQALALAAQELREPVSRILLAHKHLGQLPSPQAGQLHQGLSQLMRIINNMSDALSYTEGTQQEIRNIPAVLDEILQKAQPLLAQAGLALSLEGFSQEAYGPCDSQQLERAVLNILSNAAKFTAPGGHLAAALTRRKNRLYLSIEDTGSGICQDILGNVFFRYLRQPGIEDSRFGLGLGMVLIRAAAANHGGCVLIDQPGGTRITMTLSLTQPGETTLRSPLFRVDYAGDRDHALLELSDVLPSHLYE